MGFSIGAILPLPVRLWVGKKLYGWREAKVTRVSRHRLIKGPCQSPELEAMRYVAEHTSIPLPRTHAIHIHDDLLYIEMEYVEGTDLAVAWMTEGFLSADQKKTIFEIIMRYMGQLRELTPPTQDIVASALQNAAYDYRIGSRFFGPFSHDDFHSLLRGKLLVEHIANVFGEEAAKVHNQSYRTYFTHADLIPRNIIVRDRRVVSIIDWAFSGWYPEYWEFTKAHYDLFPLKNWYAGLYEAIPRYDTELIAERSLWTMYDEPGNPRS